MQEFYMHLAKDTRGLNTGFKSAKMFAAKFLIFFPLKVQIFPTILSLKAPSHQARLLLHTLHLCLLQTQLKHFVCPLSLLSLSKFIYITFKFVSLPSIASISINWESQLRRPCISGIPDMSDNERLEKLKNPVRNDILKPRSISSNCTEVNKI